MELGSHDLEVFDRSQQFSSRWNGFKFMFQFNSSLLKSPICCSCSGSFRHNLAWQTCSMRALKIRFGLIVENLPDIVLNSIYSSLFMPTKLCLILWVQEAYKYSFSRSTDWWDLFRCWGSDMFGNYLFFSMSQKTMGDYFWPWNLPFSQFLNQVDHPGKALQCIGSNFQPNFSPQARTSQLSSKPRPCRQFCASGYPTAPSFW